MESTHNPFMQKKHSLSPLSLSQELIKFVNELILYLKKRKLKSNTIILGMVNKSRSGVDLIHHNMQITYYNQDISANKYFKKNKYAKTIRI